MELSNFFSVGNIAFWVTLFVVIILQGHFVGDTWSEVQRWRFGYVTLLGGTGLMVAWANWGQFAWSVIALSVIGSRLLFEIYLFRDTWRTSDRENGRWVVEYFAGYLIVLFCMQGDLLISWGLMMTSLGIAGAAKTLREMVWQSFRSNRLRQGVSNGRYGE